MSNKRNKKNPTHKAEYKAYKKLLEKLIRISKNKRYESTIGSAGADTKKIWSIINEIIDRKQSKHKLPNKFNISGEDIRNKKNIATAFNQYFASIGTEMADSLPDEPGYEEYNVQHLSLGVWWKMTLIK